MPAESLFRSLFFILLGLMLIVRMFFNLKVQLSGERIMPDKAAIRREGAGIFAARTFLFFLLIAVLLLYAFNHPWMQLLNFHLPPWLRFTGFVIGLLSVFLLVWVEHTLGRQFSPQVQLRGEHQLITSGPYARVRHPMYTALDGFGLSLALVSANWFFLVFFFISLAFLVSRLPSEEQMMLERFGDSYRVYLLRTGRFFPKM